MDFQSMKRKQLQALCKKNGIPANLTNLELAERLDAFFKEKETLDDVDGEIESVEVEKKVVKKVRFGPHDEVFEIRNSFFRVEGRNEGRRKNLSLLEYDDNVAKIDDLDKNEVKRLKRKLSDGVEEEIGGRKDRIARRSKRGVAVASKDEDSEALDEKLDSLEDGRMITRLRRIVVVKGVSSVAESGKAVKNVVASDEQDVFLEEGRAEPEPSESLLKPSKKVMLPDGGLRRSQRRGSSFYASTVIGHAGVGMESSQATGRRNLKEKVPSEQPCETVQNVRRSGRNVPRDDSLATSEKKEKEVFTSNENHNDKNVARTRRKQVVSAEQVSKIEQEPPVKILSRRSARIRSKHDSGVNTGTSSQDGSEPPLLDVKSDRNVGRTKISKKRTASSKRQNKLESEERSLMVCRDDEDIAKDKKSTKRFRSKKKDNCIELCAVSSEVDEERDAVTVNQENSTLESPMKLLDAPDNAETQASHEIKNISSAKEKEKVVKMDAYTQDEEDCRSGNNNIGTEHGLLDSAGQKALIPVERELSHEEILSPSKSFSPSEPVEENQVNDSFKEAKRPLSYHTSSHCQVICGEETFCRNDSGVSNSPSKLQRAQEEDYVVVEPAPSLEQEEALSAEDEAIHKTMTEGETLSCNIKSGSNSSRKLKGSGGKENEYKETPEKRLVLSVSAANNGGELFEENLVENRRQKVILVEAPEDGLLDNKENTVLELESINLLGAALHLGTQFSNGDSEVFVEKDRLCLGEEKENEIQMYSHAQKDLENSMSEKLVSPERELSPDEIVSPLKGLSPSGISATVDRNVDSLTLSEDLELLELSASELRLTSYGVEKYYQRRCGDEKLCSNSAEGFCSPSELQEEFETEPCSEGEQALVPKDKIFDVTVPKDEILPSDIGAESISGWDLREPSGAKEEEEKEERTDEKDQVTPISIMDNNDEFLGENLIKNSGPLVVLDEAFEDELHVSKESLGSETSLNNSSPKDRVGTQEASIEDAASDALQRSESIQSFDKVSVMQGTNSDMVTFLRDGAPIKNSGSHNAYRNWSACKHGSLSAGVVLPTDQCEAPTSRMNSLDRKESFLQPLKFILDETNSEYQEDFCADEMQTQLEEPSESELEKNAVNQEICTSALLPSAANKLLHEEMLEWSDDRSNAISSQHSFRSLTTEKQTEYTATFDNNVRVSLPQEMCIANSSIYVVKEILCHDVAKEVLDGEDKLLMTRECSGAIGYCLDIVSTEVDPAISHSDNEGHQGTAAEMTSNSLTSSAEKNCERSAVSEENRTCKMIEFDMPFEEETRVIKESEALMSLSLQVSDSMTELRRLTYDPSSTFCTCTESLLSEAMEDKNDTTKKISVPIVPEVSTKDVRSDRQIDAPYCSHQDHHKKEVNQESSETYLADGSSRRKDGVARSASDFVFHDDNSDHVTVNLSALSPSTNEVSVDQSEEVNVDEAGENDLSSKTFRYAEKKSVVKIPEDINMSMNVEYTGIPTGVAGMFHVLEDQLPEDAELTVEPLHCNDAHEVASCSEGLYDIYVEIMQHPRGENFGEIDVLKGLTPEATTIFDSLDVENVETFPEEDIQTVSRKVDLTDKTFIQDKVNTEVSPLSTHVKCCKQQSDNKVLDGKLGSPDDIIINYLEDNSRVSMDKVAEYILESAFTNGHSADQVQRTSKSTTRSDNSCEMDLNIAEVNLLSSASRVKFDSGSGNQLESVHYEEAEVIEWEELVDEARDEGMAAFGQGTIDFDKAEYGLRSEDDLNRPEDVAESHSDGHKRAERETDAEPLELNEPLYKTESKLDLEESVKALDSLQYLFNEMVHEESDISADCSAVSPARSFQEHGKFNISVQNGGPVTLVREDTKSDESIRRSDNADVKGDSAAIAKSDGIKENTESDDITFLRPSSKTSELYPGELAMDTGAAASEGDQTASSLMMEMKIIGTNSRLQTPKKLSWTQDMKENATAGVKKEATNIKAVIKRRALEKIQNY